MDGILDYKNTIKQKDSELNEKELELNNKNLEINKLKDKLNRVTFNYEVLDLKYDKIVKSISSEQLQEIMNN
jgi:hypothetical protein